MRWLLAGLIAASLLAPSAAVARSEPDVRCPQAYWKDHGRHHVHTVNMAMCLAHQPGLQVSWAEAKCVAGGGPGCTCPHGESGWYDNAGRNPLSQYRGIYQEGVNEFRVFPQRAPLWAKREFHQNNWLTPHAIWNARANIIAAFAHAHRYGWQGTWSCA